MIYKIKKEGWLCDIFEIEAKSEKDAIRIAASVPYDYNPDTQLWNFIVLGKEEQEDGD